VTAEIYPDADAEQVLGQQIIDTIGAPKDFWEIAAQLEVLGLRDDDARAAYGARDLFDLARRIFERFQEGAFRFEIEGEDPEKRIHPVLRFARYYFIGFSFSLPMALQAIVMLVWGYGIWGAMDLDLRTGSAIALGFIASYIVTGGFAQAIVRRGLFYIYQGDGWLARWTVLRAWWLSLRIVLALAPLALLVNAMFDILPWSMTLTAAGYYAALSILWLNWSMLYLLHKTELFVMITAVALAAVLAAAKLAHFGPVAANAVGLAVADALSFVIALRHLGRIARQKASFEPVNPPRLTVLVYGTSRFFLYGLLYNLFLFTDRIVAWTSGVGREDFPPYGFWLNVRYELGMDLALVVVMVLSGVVEYATQRFSETLIPNEKRRKSVDAEGFLRETRDAQRRRTIALAGAAVIAVGIAIVVAEALRALPNPRLQQSLVSPTATRVFWIAVAAYVVYMFAMQNMLLLLTLQRVDLAARAVGIALCANVAVGFVCSRAMHYSLAVVGLLAGTIVLLLLTTRDTRRVLGELDYYYYAAY
jgi:Putative exopolysaccharide Exporter (EPS-E)